VVVNFIFKTARKINSAVIYDIMNYKN